MPSTALPYKGRYRSTLPIALTATVSMKRVCDGSSSTKSAAVVTVVQIIKAATPVCGALARPCPVTDLLS